MPDNEINLEDGLSLSISNSDTKEVLMENDEKSKDQLDNVEKDSDLIHIDWDKPLADPSSAVIQAWRLEVRYEKTEESSDRLNLNKNENLKTEGETLQELSETTDSSLGNEANSEEMGINANAEELKDGNLLNSDSEIKKPLLDGNNVASGAIDVAQSQVNADEGKTNSEIKVDSLALKGIQGTLGKQLKLRGSVKPISHWIFDEIENNDVIADTVGNRDAKLIIHSNDELTQLNESDHDIIANEHIEVEHDIALKPDNGTLTLWFNARATSGKATLVSCDASSGSVDGGINLRIYDGNLTLEIEDGEDKVHRVMGGEIDEGEWMQVSISWGSKGLYLFLNGLEKASSENFKKGLSNNENDWVFGASRSGSSWLAGKQDLRGEEDDFFMGSIDDIAIYNEQLNYYEMQSLFESGVEGFMNNEKEDFVEIDVEIDLSLDNLSSHRGVSIFISGISDDSTLSAGRDTKSGYFLLDPDDLDGLKLRTPSNSSPFEIMISVMFEGKEVAKKTLEYEFKDD